MNHTTNYQLSQWAKSDQVKMEDFNADNAKIDAALAALQSGKAAASTVTALQNQVAGMLKIATGTYVGTGTKGANNPTTLTLPFEAKFLVIMEARGGQSHSGYFLRGCSYGMINWIGGSTSNFQANVVWNGCTVSWTANSDMDDMQMGVKGVTYHYFAIG